MKFVRAVTDDKKATVYSLRHKFKDDLRLAGIPEDIQMLIMGHGKATIAQAYGGAHDLQMAYESMKKALANNKWAGRGSEDHEA